MSKKKAPALHERRGREDISTRPPRLAGYPIKLTGDARLRRLSLAADSCVNRKYYGGDPGVGQRKTWLHTIPPSGTRRRRPGARFSLGQVLARTKSTLSALRLVRNLRKPSRRTRLRYRLLQSEGTNLTISQNSTGIPAEKGQVYFGRFYLGKRKGPTAEMRDRPFLVAWLQRL